MNHRNRQRHTDAIERQVARDGRTSQQQLDKLDTYLGEGVGAKKERAQLLKRIEKEK